MHWRRNKSITALITVAGDIQSFTEPRCIAAIIDTFSINDDVLLTRSPSSTCTLDTKLHACDVLRRWAHGSWYRDTPHTVPAKNRQTRCDLGPRVTEGVGEGQFYPKPAWSFLIIIVIVLLIWLRHPLNLTSIQYVNTYYTTNSLSRRTAITWPPHCHAERQQHKV